MLFNDRLPNTAFSVLLGPFFGIIWRQPLKFFITFHFLIQITSIFEGLPHRDRRLRNCLTLLTLLTSRGLKARFRSSIQYVLPLQLNTSSFFIKDFFHAYTALKAITRTGFYHLLNKFVNILFNTFLPFNPINNNIY